MRKLVTNGLSLGLLSSFFVVLALPGQINTAYAADEPAAAQPGPLEIPGSFKDLLEVDSVTAKRPADRGTNPAPITSVQLEIDAEKVTGTLPVAPVLPDSGLLEFHATAYCLKGRTASGKLVQPGMIAADPRVLPLGTVVHLRAGSYTGTYTVADTGGRIKGRRVDVYVPTHKEAIQFGRRQVKLKIISRSETTARSGRTLEASAQ